MVFFSALASKNIDSWFSKTIPKFSTLTLSEKELFFWFADVSNELPTISEKKFEVQGSVVRRKIEIPDIIRSIILSFITEIKLDWARICPLIDPFIMNIDTEYGYGEPETTNVLGSLFPQISREGKELMEMEPLPFFLVVIRVRDNANCMVYEDGMNMHWGFPEHGNIGDSMLEGVREYIMNGKQIYNEFEIIEPSPFHLKIESRDHYSTTRIFEAGSFVTESCKLVVRLLENPEKKSNFNKNLFDLIQQWYPKATDSNNEKVKFKYIRRTLEKYSISYRLFWKEKKMVLLYEGRPILTFEHYVDHDFQQLLPYLKEQNIEFIFKNGSYCINGPLICVRPGALMERWGDQYAWTGFYMYSKGWHYEVVSFANGENTYISQKKVISIMNHTTLYETHMSNFFYTARPGKIPKMRRPKTNDRIHYTQLFGPKYNNE